MKKTLLLIALFVCALSYAQTPTPFKNGIKTPVITTDGFTTTQINALTGMTNGELRYDTDLEKWKSYNGASWEIIGSGGGTGADDQNASEVPLVTAINAQTDVQASLEDHETRIDALVSGGTFPGFTSLLADYGFTDNSTNWNTAFGWGDHTLAGYSTGSHTTDTNTQLSQAQVGAFATAEGFIKTFTELDPIYSAWDKDYADLINTPDLSLKQDNIILTTTGTSGVATLVGSTLNVPNYTAGGATTINNTLTSTATDEALSAAQGKVLKDAQDTKQDVLVSGTNIKTINGESLLGSTDIVIAGGGGTDDQTASEVPITDAGNIITATDVEGALQENRTAIDLNTAKISIDPAMTEITYSASMSDAYTPLQPNRYVTMAGDGTLTITGTIINGDNAKLKINGTGTITLTNGDASTLLVTVSGTSKLVFWDADENDNLVWYQDETGGGASTLAELDTVVTGAELDAIQTKVATIETNAKDDLTGAEIETLIDTQLGGTTWKTGGSGAVAVQTATGDGATSIDWSVSPFMDFTFGAQNENITMTQPTYPERLRLKLTQDGVGSRTVNWINSIYAPSGIMPTLSTGAGDIDVINLFWNGVNFEIDEDFNDYQLVVGTDGTPPTAPTGLASSNITGSTVDLTWSAATDNIGVTGYKVYQDAVEIASLGNVLTYNVTGLIGSTSYNFTVTALDSALNESVVSNTVNVTTTAAPPPSSITGLQLWLDASDTGSIVSVTGKVSQWNDLSGNGNHATQPVEIEKPVTDSLTVNSLNSITFNGSGQHLLLPSALYTIPTGNNTVFIVSKNDNGFVNGKKLISGTNGVGSRYGIYTTGTSGEINFLNSSAFSSTTINVGSLFDTTLLTLNRNGTSITGTRDGLTTATSALATDVTLTTLDLGQYGATGIDFWRGPICEVIIYNTSLSTTDFNTIGNYLAAKWGFTYTNQ